MSSVMFAGASFSSVLQPILLWPAELVVSLVLMLFHWQMEYLPYGWRIVVLGFVAFAFWANVWKLIYARIKRLFGIYR